MGINRQSEESTNLQVGPTTAGMVRIYVSSETVDLPMDFTPEDAEEIARELLTAADRVRRSHPAPPPGKPARPPGKGRQGRRPAARQRR